MRVPNGEVQVKCFGCATIIEAVDADAAVLAFVAHAREGHDWSYPEQALQNYARNVAEAGERLTGSTERLPEIADVVIHPVTADRVDDWLRFFDHEAFAGNPDWAACYCLEPNVPASPELPERLWRDARSATAQRLCDGTTSGYLAYVGGQTAGWVNASLRSHLGLFQLVGAGGPAPPSVIGVSCFVIAPPFRRHGIASALLDRVIADAPARGASWIEGYPHNEPEASDAGHFRGPRSMYESRGFGLVERLERYSVMRRQALDGASKKQ